MQKVSNAMNISQLYPRRFANGNDIGAATPTLPICKVTMEQVGPVRKPVIWFLGARKGIILHATLARQIAAIHGDDTDQWHGKRVTIHTVPVKRPDGTHALSIRARAEDAPSQLPLPTAPAIGTRRSAYTGEDLSDHAARARHLEAAKAETRQAVAAIVNRRRQAATS